MRASKKQDLDCAPCCGILRQGRRWLETLAWKKEHPCHEHKRRGERRDGERRQRNVKRRLCDDRDERAERGVGRYSPARPVEHGTQRDRRQNRTETEKAARDQVAFGAEKMSRKHRQYRTC